MQWIDFEGESPFLTFRAVQDGRLSSHLASESEIDFAADELKKQIDVAAGRMKIMLQKRPADPFGRSDA